MTVRPVSSSSVTVLIKLGDASGIGGPGILHEHLAVSAFQHGLLPFPEADFNVAAESFFIAVGIQQPIRAVFDEVTNAAAIGSDDRSIERHGFEQHRR